MKKFLSLVAVMAVAVMMSSTAWAATPFTNTSKAARASFTAEDLSVEFDLYLHQDGVEYTFGTEGNYKEKVNEINFDLSTVEIGTTTTNFAKGTVFARVSSNLKKQKAGTEVRIYTTNKQATGDYKINYTDNTKYAGLIRKDNSSTFTAGDVAPLEMHFAKISVAPTTYPTSMSDDGDAYGDRYITDKDGNGYDATYAVIGKSGVDGGIWLGYGGTSESPETHFAGTEDVIVFFGARFNNVSSGDEYGTDNIIITTATE